MSSHPGWVYIARSGPYVKIGFSRNPWQRVHSLHHGGGALRPTDIAEKATLVAVMPGSEVTEAALHAVFDEHRVIGEWYHDRGPVASWMNRLAGRSNVFLRDGWVQADDPTLEDAVEMVLDRRLDAARELQHRQELLQTVIPSRPAVTF